MGVSTDAYLIYGVLIPEWDEQGCIEQKDLPKELRDLNEDPDGEVYIGEISDDNCDMFVHCMSECPMWIATPKTVKSYRAWRGDPVEMNFADLITVDGENKAHLKAFCEKLGVKYTEPKWWLCSYWG